MTQRGDIDAVIPRIARVPRRNDIERHQIPLPLFRKFVSQLFQVRRPLVDKLLASQLDFKSRPFAVGQFGDGIHDALKESDCLALLTWTQPTADARDTADELDQIHRLVDRRVDAVILYPRVDSIGDSYLHEILDRNIPLVTVDHELPQTRADFVGTDDEAGGRMAAEHLLGQGHRVLGHIAGPAELTPGLLRRQGFESAVSACSGARCETVVDTTFGYGAGEAARKLLCLEPRPTAIFCANDLQARELYRVAAELGLAIPRDLSVVGFADLSLARDLNPPLTTLKQNPEEIGRCAAAFVLDRRDGRFTDPAPRKLRLMPELVKRQSVAAMPTDAGRADPRHRDVAAVGPTACQAQDERVGR